MAANVERECLGMDQMTATRADPELYFVGICIPHTLRSHYWFSKSGMGHASGSTHATVGHSCP